MISDLPVSGFEVCTSTFIEIAKIEQEIQKFKDLLGDPGKNIQELILNSRESPAFTTFVCFKESEEKLQGKDLAVITSVEIRLSCLGIRIVARLTQLSGLTLKEVTPLIKETKGIVSAKIRDWTHVENEEYLVLIETSAEGFLKLDASLLPSELPTLLGYTQSKFLTHAVSRSKLGELDEDKELIIMSFREAGLFKEAWVFGPPPPQYGVLQNRARWWGIAMLTLYTLVNMKAKYDSLLDEIVKLEKEVEVSTKELSPQTDQESIPFFEKLSQFRKKFIRIRYQLATLQETSECIEMNISLVKWGVRVIPSSGKPERVEEKVVVCTDREVIIPSFLIMDISGCCWDDVPTVEQITSLKPEYVSDRGLVLNKGLVGETKDVLAVIKSEVDEEKERSSSLTDRLNTHIDDIMKVVEADTALTLQKTQTILAQSTTRVDRSFGILTLVFAVFSMGQVVSAFAIWYWGANPPGNVVSVESLSWAVGVTVFLMLMAFLIALVFYLRSFKQKT